MISEKNLYFADAQALTVDAASTDFLDLGADIDIGPGEPLWLILESRAAPGGTSPTLTVSIQTDDNAAFSSATTIYTHPVIAGAAFPSGTRIGIPWPRENERYNRIYFDLGGTNPTFTVNAYLSPAEPNNWKAFPDGI